jgi:hypothetical protein
MDSRARSVTLGDALQKAEDAMASFYLNPESSAFLSLIN